MDPLTTGSYWQDRSASYWNFFCPLCTMPRRLTICPHVKKKHFFQVVLTACVFTWMTWPWMHWKGLVVVVPFWTVFEIIYRWRVRVRLPCPQCGFDPYLLLINLQWAQREVETHWKQKFIEKGIPYPEKKMLGSKRV